MQTFSNIAILQARMQAWCVNLLSVVSDVHGLGAVIGKGGALVNNGQTLFPDVMFVPMDWRQSVKNDAVHGPAALAIDMIYGKMPAAERAALQRSYAAARVLEYWQIEVDRGEPNLYQASADWTYDLIPPDKGGLHYSSAMVELYFPVTWFRRQPGTMKMLEYWGFVETESS